MGGGLMQLIAYGAQDIYLTGSPVERSLRYRGITGSINVISYTLLIKLPFIFYYTIIKKKNINQKFDKTIDALYQKCGVSKQESELLKYGNKIQQLADNDNQERAIQNERTFIRKKIDESKDEIRQLENNLQFFSNASESNPLVQDVIKRVNQHKESLAAWKVKLKKLNILKNNLLKEDDEGESADEAQTDE